MRIAIVVNELDPWGAQRSAVTLATGFAATGHEVSVLCTKGGGSLARDLAAAGIDCRIAGRGSLLRCAAWLRSELGRIRPDVVQTVLPHAALLGAVAARLAGRAAVVTCISGPVSLDRRGPRRWGEVLAHRLADRVVAVSADTARRAVARGFVARSRLAVIPNGVGLPAPEAGARERLRRELGIPEDSFVAAAVARLDPVKRLDVFLPAVAGARGPIGAVIVGEGPARGDLEGLAGRLGLGARVRLLGEHPRAADLLPAFDVAVSTSAAEGCPRAVLEALAAGCPVIAPRIPAMTEIVRHEREGWLFAPGDAGALARLLERAAARPEELRPLAEAGRARILERYTAAGRVRAYLDLYEEVLARRRGARSRGDR